MPDLISQTRPATKPKPPKTAATNKNNISVAISQLPARKEVSLGAYLLPNPYACADWKFFTKFAQHPWAIDGKKILGVKSEKKEKLSAPP
jgi:hypothetical protein